MKFFEYMAKRIFNEEGIPILEGHVANSAEEATSIASDMGVPVAIKSQVLVGGRGKAGGALLSTVMEIPCPAISFAFSVRFISGVLP